MQIRQKSETKKQAAHNADDRKVFTDEKLKFADKKLNFADAKMEMQVIKWVFELQ